MAERTSCQRLVRVHHSGEGSGLTRFVHRAAAGEQQAGGSVPTAALQADAGALPGGPLREAVPHGLPHR